MLARYKDKILNFVANLKNFILSVLVITIFPIIAFYLPFSKRSIFLSLYLLLATSLWFLGCCREIAIQNEYKKLYEKKLRLSNPLSMEKQKDEALKRSQEEIILLQNHINNLNKHYADQINPIQKSLIKTKESNHILSLELYKKSEENQELRLQLEGLLKEKDLAEENLIASKKAAEEEYRHKELLITEYRKTTYEQRGLIEKKQTYITKLETKIRDLMYEIRSLLQLEDTEKNSFVEAETFKEEMLAYYIPSEPNNTSSFLSNKLDAFISKAESFTGANYLSTEGKQPRFLDIPPNNCSIECRQLFDSLKDENVGIIFVYSKQERKMLFVNNLFKSLLGWQIDKFIKEHHHIMQDGYKEWIVALNSDKNDRDPYKGELMIKNRSGVSLNFCYYLKNILQGPLNHHVVGILYPLKKKNLTLL